MPDPIICGTHCQRVDKKGDLDGADAGKAGRMIGTVEITSHRPVPLRVGSASSGGAPASGINAANLLEKIATS